MPPRKLLIFIGLTISFCWGVLFSAEQQLESRSIFIPLYQHFNFEKGKMVDSDYGDITVLDYGIETTLPKADIAALNKGFLEDVENLPVEKEISWSDYADYSIDMIYAIKDVNNKYSIFELIDVKLSDDNRVIGVEIEYKYQPDGSQNF